MAESRNRAFAKLAKDVTAAGNIKAEGISSDVTLGGATVYATRAALPSSGNTVGDQAFVSGNNRLYIWNGSGWYNVALLNLAPSISSVQDSDGNTTPFQLPILGGTTRITVISTDSDGDPITYTAIADSAFSGLGTISQDSNTFTITSFSADSATAPVGSIVFTATDGVNVASSETQLFTLQYNRLLGLGTTSDATFSASSVLSPRIADWAVDNSTVAGSGEWHGTLNQLPAWWKADFGAGTEKVVRRYGICERYNVGNYNTRISEWELQGSNDNTNWTTLHGPTTEGVDHIRPPTPPSTSNLSSLENYEQYFVFFDVNNITPYRYYRIYITGNGGQSYAVIGELIMEGF
jgi:hypothetical protein